MEQILNEILSEPQFAEGSAWKRCWYHAGEKIIEKGELGSTLFFVEEGQVRVLGGAEIEGNKKINPGLCDMNAGSVFGDICLYGSHRRTASVVALTDVCILEIRSDMLSIYLDDHPVQGYLFLKAMFQVMVLRLELANDRIEKLLAWGLKAHDIDKYL
ncbi:cyclic nucleotide-binding domain-containing protein [Methylomonas sp. LL1]|uniref:Crp/Fnr family transcriptional regulator n=1 Tax=Methylomonas sp. LL1 TaxID=2785785 RepID=UPI0018C3C03D|nr:cyclic nucleotide-binding domain-containing protein [Methylomonas sp. LL1]QPK63289.1 cyclic nucleotide-binding domain-containing protein [Methylomonas sp. LL1]CAG1021796.1 CRP-like cAMP-activated global transcriptional regulator [Methylococcales bacterium]